MNPTAAEIDTGIPRSASTIIPPTEAAVKEMLAGTDLPPDHVVGRITPEMRAATVEKIAINAVMAGCLPTYLPVLIAAVKACADPAFNLQAIQATTNPVAIWLIVRV